MLTSHPSTPPRAPTASWTASSQWCTTSYGACRPSSSELTSRMWPPTHSIATVPTSAITASRRGIAATRPWPTRWAPADDRCASRRPMSSIFTISATTPYTRTVIRIATTRQDDGPHHEPGVGVGADHLVERDHHDLGREDEVGPDRPRDRLLLVLGGELPLLVRQVLGARAVVADPFPDLLRALVGQVGAADDQQDRQPLGQELAEQQRRRQDEQELVAQRALRDPLDDRQLAVGRRPVEVLRCDGGVVHDHARGLGAGPAGRGPDVVDRRGRDPREGRDVVEQGEDPAGHGHLFRGFGVRRTA